MVRLFIICLTVLVFAIFFAEQKIRFETIQSQRKPASSTVKASDVKKISYFKLKNQLR